MSEAVEQKMRKNNSNQHHRERCVALFFSVLPRSTHGHWNTLQDYMGKGVWKNIAKWRACPYGDVQRWEFPALRSTGACRAPGFAMPRRGRLQICRWSTPAFWPSGAVHHGCLPAASLPSPPRENASPSRRKRGRRGFQALAGGHLGDLALHSRKTKRLKAEDDQRAAIAPGDHARVPGMMQNGQLQYSLVDSFG